jgi:hypothetical protein
MLTARQLLLPGLDLLFSGEGIGLQDTINYRRELRIRLVQLDVTIEAPYGDSRVETVGFRFSGDGKFGHFERRLIANHHLARSADVQDQRMVPQSRMNLGVVAVAGAAAVEALQAYIEAIGIVLETRSVSELRQGW